MRSDPRSHRPPGLWFAIPALFFFSGAAGLVYEVVWMRLLAGVFGVTVLAISTVLAAFMAGLALGSFLFGRVADRTTRPLTVFAALQVGIGLVSLLVPLLVRFAENAYPGLPDTFRDSFWLLSLARFAWCGLIILLPTTLMGGTLPVLSRWITSRGSAVGSGVGALYSINTFGAVVGTMAGGFYLVPRLGLSTSMLIAAAANVVIGLLVLASSRGSAGGAREPGSEARAALTRPDSAAPGDAPEFPARLIVGLFALVGFCSLSYEVLWTRVLIVFVPSTTFAFTTMLSTFLVGIALGSSVSSRFADRLRSPALALGLIEAGVAVTALASLTTFTRLGALAAPRTGMAASWGSTLSAEFILPAVIMLAPALLMGAAFPVVARIRVRDTARAGSGVGSIYAANTVGSILGSFFTGFVLIPAIGIQHSVMLAACGNLFVAVVAFSRSRATMPARAGAAVLAVAAAVVLVAVAPLGQPVAISPGTEEFELEDQEVVFYEEGITSSVTVTENPNTGLRGFFVDRWMVVGTSYDAVKTVKLLGHLPIAAVDEARELAVVGYGMGMTSWTLALHSEVESLEVVELSEGVVDATGFFTDFNHNVLEDPRVSLHVDDGRNHLLMSRKQYDVISNDPIHPAGGSGALYTADFFRLVRDRLKPGGACVQYLPFHKMSLFDFKLLIRTFQSVFPNVTVWDGGGHGVMLGTMGPTSFDLGRLERLYRSSPELREELSRWGLSDAAGLLSCLMLDSATAREFAGDGPIHTDDRPLLEFSEPRSQGRDTRVENLLAISRFGSDPLQLAEGTAEELERLAPELERATRVRRTLAGAILAVSQRDIPRAADLIEDAWEIDPHDMDVAALAERIAVRFWLEASQQHLAARHYGEALALCERALRLDPDNGQAMASCGAVYASQELWDEAAGYLESAVRSEPGDPRMLAWLARVYVDGGRTEEAVEAYAHLGTLEGVDPTDLQRGLSLLVELERYGKAVPLAEMHAEANPNDPNALAVLGQCYGASGRLAEAIEVWERALELRPGDRALTQALSQAYRRSGRTPPSD
jgi:spermidine synthase